ncbi:hypothetical protein HanXRQr2_Chr02g0075281 [Helianthus annuus]|uniref:Uncharacterized protein n=1 Tax=Helianthus annuus TaxID=4232 RepID=A0A9K3JQQ0_HELAN|nr:hypothetical protein HanXRQr2_Chr02g0075281 [Helianthus annuus]
MQLAKHQRISISSISSGSIWKLICCLAALMLIAGEFFSLRAMLHSISSDSSGFVF